MAASLARAGNDVMFVGCTENPRDPSESARGWLLELLDRQSIPVRSMGDRLEYTWRGVHCVVVSQHGFLPCVRFLRRQASLVWSSQEGCDETLTVVDGCTTASYAHSVSEVGLLSARVNADWVFAPSVFVQHTVERLLGRRPILLRPPIEPSACPPAHDRSGVVFVNPIAAKGVATAVAVARSLPDVPFLFVECWRPVEDVSSFPPNVEVVPRLPSLDPLYATAVLLIVPSVVEDACPRVVLEAGAASVPVVAARRGGIPELVGRPADMVDPHDIEGWTRRCETLTCDPAEWLRSSVAQHHHTGGLIVDPIDVLRRAGVPLRHGETSEGR